MPCRKAINNEQEMHVALIAARGDLEHSLKDTNRLRVERDEVTALCEETHEKKEMYKKRLLDATESVDTMSKASITLSLCLPNSTLIPSLTDRSLSLRSMSQTCSGKSVQRPSRTRS